MWVALALSALVAVGFAVAQWKRADGAAPTWTATDIEVLKSLSLDALPRRPEDPSNAFADDPGAAELGRRLFHEPRLAAGGRLSCASCHVPERAFSDGRRVARGVAEGTRNTPSLHGVAFQRSFNWDGRSDTLWGQALGPLESSHEMGSTRGEVARLVVSDLALRAAFERVFGPVDATVLASVKEGPCGPTASAATGAPETDAARCWAALGPERRAAVTRVFVNVGKAIAAYETSLRPLPTRFDRFVQDLAVGRPQRASAWLSPAEQRGLRLFIDAPRTACLNCHNGPLLSNGGFHDIGTNLGESSSRELGRMLGEQLLAASEWRCDGPYSDALPAQCLEAQFQAPGMHGEGRGAFKVPSLRGVPDTAPYMHDGRYADLPAVLQHYRVPPMQDVPGAHELRSLALSDAELSDLARFLTSLAPLNGRSD